LHSRFWEQASATADFEHPEIKWEHSSVGSEHPALKKREGPWFLKILKIKNREHSSVGLEHLPYKQRVLGSNPSVPTSYTRVSAILKLEPFFYLQTICKHFGKLAYCEKLFLML
jgi:hypothetical protein